ncbi:MAG TPA: isochorismatase family cysteine hydrolase [Flavisolibacter sp.]|jgi:nicotinamidase-related amidase|nr:isochorismatase family cysteine hydrolase [Flavisolibacter sp.]
MQALLIIDAQNEFTAQGQRPVPTISSATKAIKQLVEQARSKQQPIAWLRHFNKSHESPAFVPHTWGSEFIPGFGPKEGFHQEQEFQKNVYGAFTGSNIGSWLEELGIKQVLIAGFYTHGCVSTTAREAIMAGYDVVIVADATGACDLHADGLNPLSAEEVKNAALLHLASMGAIIRVGYPA